MQSVGEAEIRQWADEMNREHGEALIHLARYFGGIRDPLVVEVTGLSRDELFMKVDGHGLSCTLAVPWPEPATSIDEVKRMIVGMSREARQGIHEEGLIPDGDEC